MQLIFVLLNNVGFHKIFILMKVVGTTILAKLFLFVQKPYDSEELKESQFLILHFQIVTIPNNYCS